METKTPSTLIEAVRYFADPDICLNFMKAIRWPRGVTCPTCGSDKIGFLANQRRWQCSSKHPKRQFSAKVGTVFEDSPIGLDKWLPVVWLLTNCKNGISSYEVARDLAVTQKTAWFMLQRVRLAMQAGKFWDKLEGEIEADETFIGGLARNMHKNKKAKITGTGGTGSGKAVVIGLVDRKTKQVRIAHVPNVQCETLQTQVRKYVQGGSYVFTDAWLGYHGLDREYVHKVIDHAETYVQGNVHTNTIENFWSLLKRGLKGTYISVEPFHLFRYLDEQAFRYNHRTETDAERFLNTLSGIEGKRLTYSGLTGKTETQAAIR